MARLCRAFFIEPDRMPYLRFDNLDLKQPTITAHCSLCDRTFKDEVRAGERAEDAVLRIRREYEEHTCVMKR